jgi:MFS family permease
VLHDLHEGLSYVWGFAPIRALLILMAVLSFTGMPAFTTLAPVFAAHYWGPETGSKALGLLMGASGLGALVGATYLAGRKTVVGLGRWICIAGATFGLALMAFSYTRSMTLALLVVPAIGWGMLMNFASCNTLVQTLADEDKRGRVMSFFTMSVLGVAPFGSLVAGALARRLSGGDDRDNFLGASYTLRLAGLTCLIAAGVFMLKLPALRRLIRPIYVRKGILPPEVATGLGAATEVVSATQEGASVA